MQIDFQLIINYHSKQVNNYNEGVLTQSIVDEVENL